MERAWLKLYGGILFGARVSTCAPSGHRILAEARLTCADPENHEQTKGSLRSTTESRQNVRSRAARSFFSLAVTDALPCAPIT
jgi:hypothetical protein